MVSVFGSTPLVPVLKAVPFCHVWKSTVICCLRVPQSDPPKGKLGAHNHNTKLYVTWLGGSLVLNEPILLTRLCVPCTPRPGCPAKVSLGEIQNPFSTRIGFSGQLNVEIYLHFKVILLKILHIVSNVSGYEC